MPLSEEILQALEAEKKELEDKVYQAQCRIREINELVSHATKLAINWQEQAMKCLRGTDAPLTTDEILRCIFRDEPGELVNQNRRKNYIGQLSLALNRLCSKEVIIGEAREGFKGKFYYLKEWKGFDGNIKPEYRIPFEMKLIRIKAEKNRSLYA